MNSTDPATCRTGVLISGSGTNLQSFIDAAVAGQIRLEIAMVLSNRADAFGLERAARAGIAHRCIAHGDFAGREAFDRALASELEATGVELIVLAGFMRILSSWFVNHYAGRILNIHPALLPRYPGLDTHQRALDAGDRQHGSTVHFVTEELDGGPRILAGRLPVHAGETAKGLMARVQAVEHRIYPQAADWYAAGRLRCRDGAAWLDGERLDEPVVLDFP